MLGPLHLLGVSRCCHSKAQTPKMPLVLNTHTSLMPCRNDPLIAARDDSQKTKNSSIPVSLSLLFFDPQTKDPISTIFPHRPSSLSLLTLFWLLNILKSKKLLFLNTSLPHLNWKISFSVVRVGVIYPRCNKTDIWWTTVPSLFLRKKEYPAASSSFFFVTYQDNLKVF